MSRWFRMHDEVLDDPKVQKLSPEDFKGWINLLCLTSKNRGRLPSISDIAFALRVTENAVTTLLERLLNATLIECRNGGADGKHYVPYKWDERQYKSDTSAERMKRHRERHRDVTVTPPEAETEQSTEQSTSTAKAVSVSRPTQFEKQPPEFRAECLEWARLDKGWTEPQAENEFRRFEGYCLAHGKKYKKWDAAWHNWCGSDYCKTASPAQAAAAYRREPIRMA